MTSSTTATAEGITITRAFDAPPEAVFAAWTDPEQFGQWFGGSETTCEDVVFDVRPAGTWRATMVLPDGNRINWIGEYVEVDPPTRLVLTMADDPATTAREVITVELSNVDGGTHMLFTQTGGHNTEQRYAEAAHGWGCSSTRWSRCCPDWPVVRLSCRPTRAGLAPRIVAQSSFRSSAPLQPGVD